MLTLAFRPLDMMSGAEADHKRAETHMSTTKVKERSYAAKGKVLFPLRPMLPRCGR